jgi:hypothetical protein
LLHPRLLSELTAGSAGLLVCRLDADAGRSSDECQVLCLKSGQTTDLNLSNAAAAAPGLLCGWRLTDVEPAVWDSFALCFFVFCFCFFHARFF